MLRHGPWLAAWGEPDRADLTFSVAKTYLALLAEIAHDRGLIPDPDEPVAVRVPGVGFESAQNAPISWTMLLQQASEWEGNCFGLLDTVDRWRVVAYHDAPAGGRKGDPRPPHTPGIYPRCARRPRRRGLRQSRRCETPIEVAVRGPDTMQEALFSFTNPEPGGFRTERSPAAADQGAGRRKSAWAERASRGVERTAFPPAEPRQRWLTLRSCLGYCRFWVHRFSCRVEPSKW